MSEGSPAITRDGDEPRSAAVGMPSIPGYEIIRELARGGQGVVYQAVQLSTKRKVAIKVLLDGTLAAPAAQKRFLREVELAARLRHPNIIAVFDSGVTAEGRQFCVMDYVRGVAITEQVRSASLDLLQTLRLFRGACEAVAYAHQHGVIHRDLKPSNILVDPEGSARILDFGLAKTIGDGSDALSQTGQIVGTPRYMSPEQTRGNPDEIDTRSDVYSLGMILYELLTGKFPYPVQGSLVDVMAHITTTAPESPARKWSRGSGVSDGGNRCPIDDEISTITLKALHKSRDHRYQTAGELARDLGHYLAGEPIEAKRDSSIYQLRKLIGRHRGPVIAAALVLLVAAAGFVASAVAWRRAANARQAAEENLARANEEEEVSRVNLARAYARQHQFALARNALLQVDPNGAVAQDWHWAAWEYYRRSGEISSVDLNSGLDPSERMRPAREIRMNARFDIPNHCIWVKTLVTEQFDMDSGKKIPTPANVLSSFPDSPFQTNVHLDGDHGGHHVVLDAKGWPERTESTLALLKVDGSTAWKEAIPQPGLAGAGSLSDDGNLLAISMMDGTVQIREIHADHSSIIRIIDGIDDDVVAMAFDPDGQRLHVLTGGWLHRIYSISADADIDKVVGAHSSTVRKLAFDAGGRLLASGGYDGMLTIWDARTHQKLKDILVMKKGIIAPLNGITETRFLPDDRILTADANGFVNIWDWDSGTRKVIQAGPGQGGAAASDDGTLVYASHNNNITPWNMETESPGTPFGQFQTQERESNYRILWPKGKNRLIVLRSPEWIISPRPEEIRCEIWDISGPNPTLERVLRHHTDSLRDADLSADEKLLAVASRDGTATLWDWQRGTLMFVLEASPGHSDVNIISGIRFDPAEPVVATAGQDDRVIFWSTRTGRQLAELNVDEQHVRGFGSTGLLKDIAFIPDGKWLAITVGNDIWWMDMGFFDARIRELARR